ncbi:WD40-repeat-containing domain protein, partial [Syncephalis pseudoplumigaleata]
SSYPAFGVRYSRPCNVVAFSEAEPRLLATGLDKVRNDHCLAIWDVEQARSMAESSSLASDQSAGQPGAGSGKGDAGAEATGLLRSSSTGSSTANQAASAPKPIQQYGMSEAVLSCAWFPQMPAQLVAGMAHKWLRVYDTRSSDPPSVTISTKAVYGVQVDPFHDKRMASFTEDGIVRIWDVRKPAEAVLNIQAATRSASLETLLYSPRRSGLLATHGKDSPYIRLWDLQEGTTRHYTSTTILPRPPSGEPIDIPVLWRSRQTKPALRPLASFAWIPTNPGRATSSLMSVNRDGVIECVELQEARRTAWDPSGGLLVAGDQDIFVFPTSIMSNDASTIGAQKLGATESRNNRQAIKAKAMEELRADISVVMRERAVHGYSMNAEKNRALIRDDRQLTQVWAWLATEEQLSSMGRLVSQGVDFSYQGVLHIVQGGWLAPKRSTSTPQTTSPMLITRTETPDSSATGTAIEAKGEEAPMAPTLKPELRTIALLALGFGGRIESTMESLQASGDYERAAAWALFHGKVGRAVAALSSSKDEKHRLISTVLAGYHRDASTTNTWRELCKSLSADLKGPYLRAIFAYIASGEWSSVLAIGDLPFRDRLGVALRFLDDEEV